MSEEVERTEEVNDSGNIKLSKQTKTLFVQLVQKVIFEGANIRETLNDLEFKTDADNLLHCVNPPTVIVKWEMLEDLEEENEEEETEDFFGIEED